MRDAQPLVAELRRDQDAVAELLGQVGEVDLVEILERAPGEDGLVRLELVEHEVALAQHRRVDVVDRRGQQLAARQRVGLLAQQAVGDQHLGEHRGGLGERQRGVLGEDRVALATSRTRPV